LRRDAAPPSLHDALPSWAAGRRLRDALADWTEARPTRRVAADHPSRDRLPDPRLRPGEVLRLRPDRIRSGHRPHPDHDWRADREDRKSTRLNSSHVKISY